MTEDVSRRARQRADEARRRAAEAGQRAEELRAGEAHHDDSALARSKEALERARELAKEGYRHAAEAERAAGRAHASFADAIERGPRASTTESDTGEQVARHRQSAEEHFRKAEVDESALEGLEDSPPS